VARVLRALAVGAALAAATLSTTWGLLFYRPLPTIDGHFRLLGLHQRAEVVRDVFGAPRIEAADVHDLFLLQGYVTAQDRLAQMEALREAGRARWSGADREVTPRLRDALEAYAEGVNKLVAQHAEARALPGELVLAGRRPAPWTSDDPLAIAAAFLSPVSPSSCAAIATTLRGRPLLVADLYFAAPDPGWYVIGLEHPRARAVGASIPGVPGIVAGHNGWLAWSLLSAPHPARGLDALLGTLGATASGPARSALVASEAASCFAAIDGRVASDGSPAGPLAAAVAAGRPLDPERTRALLGPPADTGAGLRLIVDLADVETSRIAVSSGGSGQLASRHRDDQRALWEAGQLRRLPSLRPSGGLVEGELVLRAR